MLAALIIAGVIIMTVGSIVKRLMDYSDVPWFIWPALLLAAAAPSYVAYQVLNPGDVVDSAVVHAMKDVVELDVPDGYAIMVTADLNDEIDENEPNSKTTAYSLALKSDAWAESSSGTIRRKSAGGGPDIDLMAGNGISESGKQRSGKWGEDLQDRIDLKKSGHVEVRVTNWQGLAAKALRLDVLPGPPSGLILWGLVGFLSAIGLLLEVRYGLDRVSGDLAFLALWAVFLRDGVTPLDDFQRVGYAVLPAALLGWGLVAGIAWVAVKYITSKEKARAAAAEAAANPEPEPQPEAPRARRHRRHREDDDKS